MRTPSAPDAEDEVEQGPRLAAREQDRELTITLHMNVAMPQGQDDVVRDGQKTHPIHEVAERLAILIDLDRDRSHDLVEGGPLGLTSNLLGELAAERGAGQMVVEIHVQRLVRHIRPLVVRSERSWYPHRTVRGRAAGLCGYAATPSADGAAGSRRSALVEVEQIARARS
jgi:hypothetical protein